MTDPTPQAPPPQPRVRYRLYLDESGDHTYNLLDDPAHRYLALLGVWFRQPDHYTAFADDLERFKRDIFGPRPDRPVVLHRSDIINRKGPFGLLREAGVRERFDAGLLEVIGRAAFKMVCVVIDKQNHLSRYEAHAFHLIPDSGDVFGKRICEAVRQKFNFNEWQGQVEGYGKVFL